MTIITTTTTMSHRSPSTIFLSLTECLKKSENFLFDELSSTMICMVSIVSCIIHIYSTDYMGEDPHIVRFLSYLTLFTFFMLILITADNYLLLFIGWEGVGLSSYLLINF